MSSDEPSGSGLTKPLKLDLKCNISKTYVPNSHCIFCLKGGSILESLTTHEDGRKSVKEVCCLITYLPKLFFFY